MGLNSPHYETTKGKRHWLKFLFELRWLDVGRPMWTLALTLWFLAGLMLTVRFGWPALIMAIVPLLAGYLFGRMK